MLINKWITSANKSSKAVYFREQFSVKNCQKAVLEITALGWFKAFINGKEVSNEEFLPGWTDYTKRVPLFRYDITGLLKKKNAIGVVVGKGWAAGSACWGRFEKYYNVQTPCLYARIIWTDLQGREHIVKDAWKFGYGRIVENDIMYGETQDYTFDCVGFDRPEFDDSAFQNVCIVEREVTAVENISPKVCVRETLTGEWIATDTNYRLVDFRQNFAGITKITVKAFGLATLTVRHGEMLDSGGRLYTENLKTAKATDRYALTGGEYDLRPFFTYHGFRYAELTWEGDLEIVKCEGCAIYMESKKVGEFETSIEIVNQIESNCLWTLKSNFLYIPTDCPQRDERLGWLGDAGVFARSAMYQMDCEKFFEHYLSVIAEAIRPDGAIPSIAPIPQGFLDDTIGASGWADAFLIILNDHYDFYANKKTLETYFPYAERFIEWVEKNSTGYKRNTYCFSDWLSINADLKEGYGDVDFEVFDICHYGIDCLLMQKFCRVLGLNAKIYEQKHQDAKNYFRKKLWVDGAPIGKGRQTALLLAYKAGFVSAEDIEKKFVSDLDENGLTCGFIGVKYLLPVLTEIGRSDVAYQLITSKEYPSWGYSIINGATTMWERWDSYTKEHGFHDSGMNSFNHFAFGSCVEWFYSDVLGIKYGETFNTLRIEPCIDWSGKVTWAKGSFRSRYGKVTIEWYVEKNKATIEIKIPTSLACEYNFKNCAIVKKEESEKGIRFILNKRG